MILNIRFIIIIFCITITFKAFGQAKITSDSFSINNKTLSAEFKGSVIIFFEDVILKTDKLIVYYNQKQEKKSIKKIEIPCKLKVIKNCNTEVIIADKGEYISNSNTLTLTGNVIIEKDSNIIVTDKMTYITKP